MNETVYLSSSPRKPEWISTDYPFPAIEETLVSQTIV